MDLLITIALSTAVQLLLFLYLRGRIEQQLNATDLLKNVQIEVDAMVRELNVSAERNIGVLEARIADMEALLARADQKVMVLQRELERRERTAEVYTNIKRPVVELEGPKPEVKAAEAAPPQPEVTTPAVSSSAPVVEAPPKTLKQRVVEYREQGRTSAEIAMLTGATQGEVELILSLQQNLFNSSN